MQRGQIVEYLFPGLVDAADPDTILRARAQLIRRLAIVRSVTGDRADIAVLDSEDGARIVREVLIVTQEPAAPNRNQVTDREEAIRTNTLDSIRDVVKGYVKEL